MGNFLDAEEFLALTTNPELKMMDENQIETLFIVHAEREIDDWFNLELDTNLFPADYTGRMQSDSALAEKFQNDFKTATILFIERTAMNPHGFKSESQAGSSVRFGSRMPPGVSALMKRWGKSGRVHRA